MQDTPQWHNEEVLKRRKENKAPQDAFEILENMNTQQLQNDKLKIIQWIIELKDYSMVEKIKSLMYASSVSYTLTDEQQEILNSQVNEDKSQYYPAEKLYDDLKNKYEL